MTTAFLGLGLMGRPMTATLAAAGHAIIAYNRNPVAPPPGVTLADSACEAMRGAQQVMLMLSDAEACQGVLLAEAARPMLAGRLVINHSTISPEQSRALASAVQEAGGRYLECPVLGSLPEAGTGRLQLMVGGREDDYRKALPLLEALGKPLHVGPVGQASAIKLALNQLIGSLTGAFALSLGLVQREGASVDHFMRVLRESALYAPTFDKKLDRMLSRQFDNPNFPLKHLLKDMRLFTQAACKSGLDTHQLVGLQHILEHGIEHGLDGKDYSALYNEVVPRREEEPPTGG